MKILVTAANGQVGFELARCLLPFGDVLATHRTQLDLSDFKKLQDFVNEYNPDVIVNAAAYTAVDKAETQTDLAFLMNAKVPEVLAEIAKKNKALFIHYSTDYVFDGTKEGLYVENDQTNPINQYGKSKLEGEKAIEAIGADYLILRTSWVYTTRGQNFLKTILRLAANHEQLNIVDDQIGSPTWARLIAETSAHILKQSVIERRQDNFYSSIYHLTSTGSTSWYGFAKQIIDIALQQERSILKNCTVNPILTKDYPLPAKRPTNSRLSSICLEQHFGLKMPTWDNVLKLCMES